MLATGSWHNPATAQTSWRGLVVAPESRCSPYDADDYRYPQSVEDRVIAELGGVYGSASSFSCCVERRIVLSSHIAGGPFVCRRLVLGSEIRFSDAPGINPSGRRVLTVASVVFYIESRRFLIRDSPRPATTYEQKTGGADGVKGA